MDAFQKWEALKELWQTDKSVVLSEFIAKSPSVWDYEDEFLRLRDLGEIIAESPSELRYGGLSVFTGIFIYFCSKKTKNVLFKGNRNFMGGLKGSAVLAECFISWI